MGNTDSIPFVSQAKSLVQVIGGDAEGARQTQENFLWRNTWPFASQSSSLLHLINGDPQKALDLQVEFAKNLERVVDSIPVAGHVKGAVHFAMGDNERGDQVMIAANRATGVAAGGVGGFFVGGPPGAVAGGIAGGVAMDTLHTGVELAVHGPEKAKGHGIHGVVDDLVKTGGEGAAGKIFDAGVGIAVDGVSGLAAGKAAGALRGKITGGGGGGTKSKTGRGCLRRKRGARSRCGPVEEFELTSMGSSRQSIVSSGSGSVSTSGLRIGGVSLKTAGYVVGGLAVGTGAVLEGIHLYNHDGHPSTDTSSGHSRPQSPSSPEWRSSSGHSGPQSPEYPQNIDCADIIQDINGIQSDPFPAPGADFRGQIAEFRNIRCDVLEAQTRLNHGVWGQLRQVVLNPAHPANFINPIREYLV